MLRSLAVKLSFYLILVMSLVVTLAGYMHANGVYVPLAAGIVLVLILSCSTLFVQAYISIPLDRLSSAMRELEQGDSKTRLHVNGSREMRELSASFNLMAVRIFRLLDETARKQVSLAQAEIKLQHHEELHHLNTELTSRLAMIERLLVQKEQAFMGTISALVSTVEANDPYTHGHSERVTAYSLALARKLGLPRDRQNIVEKAGLLHDIGKIGVEKHILHKPGRLDDAEMAVMQKHPEIGMAILGHIEHIEEVRRCVGQHHERYDGKGYPKGLSGEELMLESRILAVVDTFDAMTSDRPYRKGLPVDYAINELLNHSGTQFDPETVRNFVELLRSEKSTDTGPIRPDSPILHTEEPEYQLHDLAA